MPICDSTAATKKCVVGSLFNLLSPRSVLLWLHTRNQNSRFGIRVGIFIFRWIFFLAFQLYYGCCARLLSIFIGIASNAHYALQHIVVSTKKTFAMVPSSISHNMNISMQIEERKQIYPHDAQMNICFAIGKIAMRECLEFVDCVFNR